jgi:hypothetical protein
VQFPAGLRDMLHVFPVGQDVRTVRGSSMKNRDDPAVNRSDAHVVRL